MRGGLFAVDAMTTKDGASRWLSESPPTIAFHGTNDTTVAPASGDVLCSNLTALGAACLKVDLPGEPHACWDATVTLDDGSEQSNRAGSPFKAHKHFSPGNVLLLQSHLSAGGLVEYNSHTFCGEMYGSLVTVMFAATDNIVGYAKQGGVVSADGGSKNCKTRGCRKLFEPGAPQAAKFLDPLQIALESPESGTLVVAEFLGNTNQAGALTTAIPYLAKDPQVTTATTVVAALPVPLDGAAAAVVGNTIFVFGGAGSNAIWEYKPGTNKYKSAGTVPGCPELTVVYA